MFRNSQKVLLSSKCCWRVSNTALCCRDGELQSRLNTVSYIFFKRCTVCRKLLFFLDTVIISHFTLRSLSFSWQDIWTTSVLLHPKGLPHPTGFRFPCHVHGIELRRVGCPYKVSKLWPKRDKHDQQ